MRGTILTLVGILVFLGCTPPLMDGEIYQKEFVPEHQITVDDSHVETIGDISFLVMDSHVETVPDQYFLNFRKIDEASGKWKTNRKMVDRDIYLRYQEGDLISFVQ